MPQNDAVGLSDCRVRWRWRLLVVDKPLGGGFLDCVAFLDGPLQNVNLPAQ
jgi:hypothetical protein